MSTVCESMYRENHVLSTTENFHKIDLNNCKNSYVSVLCIDEQLQAFRGRCRFKVHNPNKPARYGIQYWLCNDVKTSYVRSEQIYQGGK